MKMKKVTLPSVGLEISALTIGCWSFGGGSGDYWGAQEQRDVDALVQEALDMGVNTFDTATGYNGGQSEVSLGKALGSRRSEAVIGDKLRIIPREELSGCEKKVTDALKRLVTDYIDLLSIHWPTPDDDLLKMNLEELEKLRERGLIRHIGVSNFGPHNMETAFSTGIPIASNQMAYNLICRAVEEKLIPQCLERGVLIATYMPLMQGILAGKYSSIDEIPLLRRRSWHFRNDAEYVSSHGELVTVHPGCEDELEKLFAELRRLSAQTGLPVATLTLGWLIHQKGVGTTIVGCRNPEQLRRNAEAVMTDIPADVLSAVTAASETIKTLMHGELDIWHPGDIRRII